MILPIGVIAVDSIYTPVERVNLKVENTRVGQITDYDKLTLDVYTNGTLAPDEAVSLAAKVSERSILSLFIDLSENAKSAEVMVEKEDNEKEKVLEMNIDELELSVRSLQLPEACRNQYRRRALQPDFRGYDEGS